MQHIRILIREGKKTVSLFFLLLIFSLQLSAQAGEGLPFKMAFKLAPFGLLDFYSGPNLKIGIDYRITKKLYGGLDGGGIVLPLPSELKHNSGFFVRKEIKYISTNVDAYRNGAFYYIGAEVFYKYQQFDRGDSIKVGTTYFKEYTMYKNSIAFNLKIGSVIYFLKDKSTIYDNRDYPRFFLEVFMGAGVRQTTAYCAGLTDKEADNREITGGKPSVIFNTPNGFRVLPSFTFSLKFGWRIF